MTGNIKRSLLPPRGLLRLRPSAAAEARGYMQLRLEGGGAGERVRFVPVGGGLTFFLRAGEESVTVSLGANEAAVESVAWCEAALAMLRRRFTRLRQAVLDLDGVEYFPCGPKKRTKRYRKHVLFTRRTGTPPDGQIMRDHPELIVGWPLGSDTAPAARVESNRRTAVAVHLYYVALWPEIETLLKRWSCPFTLFLTLNQEDAELETRVRAAFPDCVIRVVDNRGRDVRPFLLLLEEGAFAPFDLLCKIHGKKSLGYGRIPIFGEIMRRAMYLDLVASDAEVREIVQKFHDDPQIGLIGPRRFRVGACGRPSRDPLGRNRQAVEEISARMGGTIHEEELDFFEGTMFWARPEALTPLRRLHLTAAFPEQDAGLGDGALEHAIERLFNQAVHAAGFDVADVTFDLSGRSGIAHRVDSSTSAVR